MSLAIATASREDRPNSTIGVDSLIESGAWPVASPIQLRSHSRISSTDISGPPVLLWAGRSIPESSCASVMFT